MSVDLRMPNINGSEKEQLVQIRSYLYQLIPQLQWALDNVNITNVSSEAVERIAQQINSTSIAVTNGEPIDAASTFAQLKDLIIKSADIVEAYYEKINYKLDGVYVAQSDFGTYAEATSKRLEETSTYTDEKFDNVQVIIGKRIDENIENLNTSFGESLEETESKMFDEVKAVKAEIDSTIDVVNERIDGVNTSIENTNVEIENVNTRIDETNETITGTNNRIDEANAKILAVEDSITETNNRIDGVNDAITETNKEIQGVNDLITSANGKIDNLTETIENTNDNIDMLIEAKDLNEEDVQKLNGAISKINGEISEIDGSVKTIESNVESIDSQVKEVEGRVEDVSDSVMVVDGRLNEVNDSVGKVENSIKETNDKVDTTNGAVDTLKSTVSDTSEKVSNLNSAIEDANNKIKELQIAIIDTDAYIRKGILYYDEDIPIYGLEIGQRTEKNGEEVFNKYARFVSNKLSFYDSNDFETAYISDKKLYINNVEINFLFKMGGFEDTVQPNKSIVTKWVG